jgi:hypothetical protein
MHALPAHNLKELAATLAEHDFIIVGEMHGSAQNAPLMRDLLTQVLASADRAAIALEWTLNADEQTALRSYIQSGLVPAKLPNFFLDSDGRFTPQHINLLAWIRRFNQQHGQLIDLCFFDDETTGTDPEKGLANVIIAYHRQHPATSLLIETGNFHARKQTGRSRPSMATWLTAEGKVLSIFLRYLSGRITIEGRTRDVTLASSQQENPDKLYDVVIEIPKSDPAPIPSDLTEIQNLLEPVL